MFTAGYLFRDLWSGSQSVPPITKEDLLQVFKQHSPKDPFSMLTKEAVRQIVKEQIQITPQEENVCPTAREDILHLIKQQEQIEETLQEVKVSTVTKDDILQIVKEHQSLQETSACLTPQEDFQEPQTPNMRTQDDLMQNLVENDLLQNLVDKQIQKTLKSVPLTREDVLHACNEQIKIALQKEQEDKAIALIN